ncbi:MAG: hypothetical protein MUF87_09230 [Anaerolineae bacterium]|jgi:capsular polysaccharide biosynthesis protein|nr:hypothetical protein [Anaerolineae bacterium]
MSLVDYLRVLIRRGWIIVLLALVAAGSAYWIAQRQTVVYRSTQLVVLQPSRADLGLSESIIRIMSSYAQILQGSNTAQTVIEALNLDILPDALRERVSIEPDTLRLTIRIDVNDTDPNQANLIANAYADFVRNYQNERNQRGRREDRIDVVTPDVARAGLYAPRPTLAAIAGAVLGVLVGGVLVFVLEFLESGVFRRRDDIATTLRLDVLAAVPADLD